MQNIDIISQMKNIKELNISGVRSNWYMLYLKLGDLTLTLNSNVYDLQTNSVVFISPNDFYFIKENAFTVYSVLELNFEKDIFELQDKCLKLNQNQTNLINSFLESDVSKAVKKQSILQLFLLSCEESENDVLPNESKKNKIFKNAVSLMERYIASDLSVSELSKMLSVSLSSFKRIFKQFTSIGVHDYFIFLKINKAKELLLSGNSVTHTAKVLQFSSQSYFSTTFKRITGVSAKSFSLGKSGAVSKVIRKSDIAEIKRRDLPDYLL